jgi:L-2,4-diaminobutyrate transaminase
VAGLWCVNIGYGRSEVADAMAEAARRLGYYHTFSSFSNEPQIRLADRILSLAPAGMSKVFFGNSGSDANDTQIKLVWYYNNLRGKPHKKKIVGRLLGYHGTTVATASASGCRRSTGFSTCPSPTSSTRPPRTTTGTARPAKPRSSTRRCWPMSWTR